MSIYQALGWGLFAALSYYIPIRVYAERENLKSKFSESIWPPLLISYAIWYIPIIILLVGAVLFEKLFYGTFYCSSVALTAILWAYLGHKWVHGKSLNDDPNSH